MTRRLFVLVPAAVPTGPLKGAYALANASAGSRPVTLVTLKHGPGVDAPLHPAIERVALADRHGSWKARLEAYRGLLRRGGGRAHAASISMCFSADMINAMCRADAITCASVRGNLLRNYRMDYGPAGVPAAMFHLAAMRRFDRVVAITAAMARQVSFYAGRAPAVIGNFVDEEALERYRRPRPADGPFRFVFVASLTTRKQPLAAIAALAQLRRENINAVLDVVGSGHLSSAVAAEIGRQNLSSAVTLHGHIADPYPLISQADAMVLPSLSEGLARAALEALHLGVPCVLRDADGNSELLVDRSAGRLFHRDDELAEAMLTTAQQSRQRPAIVNSLLPSAFRQREAARRYLDLIDQAS